MLGWYLLEGGEREKGEATFAAARAERRDLEDPDAYCRIIEARLRETRGATGRAPSVAPMAVDALDKSAAVRPCPGPPAATTPAGAAPGASTSAAAAEREDCRPAI